MSGIDSIEIKRFRGLQDIQLNKLSPINLLVGDNNAGKTSILEVIELLSDPLSERNFRLVSRMRERYLFMRGRLSYVDAAIWLFPGEIETERRIELFAKQGNHNHQLTLDCSIETEFRIITEQSNSDDLNIELEDEEEEVKTVMVKARYNDYQETTYKISEINDRSPTSLIRERNENPHPYQSEFVSSIDHRMRPISSGSLSAMIKNDDRPKMLQLLQKFDPDIEHIELLLQGNDGSRNEAIPYVKHKQLGLAPVMVFGDGLRKALTLSNAIIRAKGGILLVDEVETGIHTSMLNPFFQWLAQACLEYDVQLFATTHSLEAVDAMLLANEEALDRFSLYRFSNDASKKVKHFSGESVYKLRQLLGQDVR